MAGFSFYYIEANIVCVVVFGIMLLHNHFNIDRQEKQIKFDHALLAFTLYFLSDSVWAAIVSNVIPKTRFNAVAVDFLLYLFMTGITYTWLDYVMAYEQAPHRNRPINRFAVVFPFLVSTIALILNYLIAPQALIDDALDTTLVYGLYLVTVPYIYMAAILFYTLRRARAEENPAEKRSHLLVGFFPLITIAGGIVEMWFLPDAPIFCFTAMILMLIFYIQSIERRVSLDPLTGLNNRGQLTRYCAQASNLQIEGRLTVVIMLDIDKFKAINDTYGHAEGDKALLVVSDALKTVVNRHGMPSFLCRYGGDEFIIIIHPTEMGETVRLIAEIREEIGRGERAFPLSVSAGYDALKDIHDTIQDCIVRADAKLYEDKKRIA